MKKYLLALLLMLASSVVWAKVETSELILPIINDPANDDLNCEKAASLSEGKIEKSNCLEALPAVKESCASAVNSFIGMYVTTVEQSKYVVRTVMFCQLWESLGYETITTEDGVQYVKQPGGILP